MMSSTKLEVHEVSQQRQEYRAMAIGNMHEKFGKDLACCYRDNPADGQRETYRHTHHNTSQPLPRAK